MQSTVQNCTVTPERKLGRVGGKKERILEYCKGDSRSLTMGCHGAHRFCDSIVKLNAYKDSSCSVIKFLNTGKIFAFMGEWSSLNKA